MLREQSGLDLAALVPAGGGESASYLAHMMLRQVDWSLRHHPGTQATAHHLRLAGLVAADLATHS
jgi:hypothetical protein